MARVPAWPAPDRPVRRQAAQEFKGRIRPAFFYVSIFVPGRHRQ